MHLLAIQWAVIGVKAAQLILSFSILVTLHELGHFIPAKRFGCRVDKFYLFFDPWFSLFKKKVGNTEYGIGWIPFGGYVKIAGMIDESMDKEQMQGPAQPWEFRSKPAWQRLIIMLGGVTVNILLAIVIFIGITWKWGEQFIPPAAVPNGLYVDSLGKSIGLRDGDLVTSIDGKPVRDELRVPFDIATTAAKVITVRRDGADMQLPLPSSLTSALNSSRGANFASVRLPGVVRKFATASPAEKAGMQLGDRLVGIDSLSTPYLQDFQAAMKGRKGGVAQIRVLRGAQQLALPVNVSSDGKIGIEFETRYKKLGVNSETKEFTFLESIPAGLSNCWNTLTLYVKNLGMLFSGKVKVQDSLGSIFSFGSAFSGEWDWQSFWSLTAFFSVILAFMNLLPIPGLDGGHALFTLYEIITGKKPSDKFMEIAVIIGFVILGGLMVLALGLDVWRFFFKK